MKCYLFQAKLLSLSIDATHDSPEPCGMSWPPSPPPLRVARVASHHVKSDVVMAVSDHVLPAIPYGVHVYAQHTFKAYY